MDDLFMLGLIAVAAVLWVRVRFHRAASRARLARMRELERELAESRRSSAHWYLRALEARQSAAPADEILGAETIE